MNDKMFKLGPPKNLRIELSYSGYTVNVALPTPPEKGENKHRITISLLQPGHISGERFMNEQEVRDLHTWLSYWLKWHEQEKTNEE